MSNRVMQISTAEDQAARWASYGWQDRLAGLPSKCNSSDPADQTAYAQGYWEADFILRCEASEDGTSVTIHSTQPIDTDSYYTPSTDAEGFPICGTCGGAVATWAPGSPDPCNCPVRPDPYGLNANPDSVPMIPVLDPAWAEEFDAWDTHQLELEEIAAYNHRNRYILRACVAMVLGLAAALLIVLPLIYG